MERNLPERRPPGANSFDTRSDAVRQWIDELPIMNIGESSRRLYNALLEINSLDLDVQQRFNGLEALGEPVSLVIESLKKHYLGHAFPLDEKPRKVSDLCKALYEQLATGYRIVAAEQSRKGRFRKDSKMMLTATYRGMAKLGQVLLKSFQVYAPYPPHIWREIHELYHLAEEQGYHEQSIKDPDEFSADTISGLYKQILLLALACPYRLRQGAVELIYAKLKDWSATARLSPMTVSGNLRGLFVVNLATDDPPTYLILKSANYHPESSRILTTEGIDERISEEMARIRNQESTPGKDTLHESYLRGLLLAWGVMPNRKFARRDEESQATVAMGLSAAHFFISGEQVFSPPSKRQDDVHYQYAAAYQASETDANTTTPDLWELGQPADSRQDHVTMVDFDEQRFLTTHEMMTGKKLVDDRPESPAPPPSYRLYDWKMVDVSAGGYRLLWDSRQGSQAEVGELLGIRDSHDPDSFHMALGVVRWMKCDNPMGVELGVQMISPGAVAVGSRLVNAPSGTDYLRSLLLPEIATIGQPATLITPTLPFHLGDRIQINRHGKEIAVELIKLVENTGTFAQYQFRALQSTQPAEKDHPASSATFESLWQEI